MKKKKHNSKFRNMTVNRKHDSKPTHGSKSKIPTVKKEKKNQKHDSTLENTRG